MSPVRRDTIFEQVIKNAHNPLKSKLSALVPGEAGSRFSLENRVLNLYYTVEDSRHYPFVPATVRPKEYIAHRWFDAFFPTHSQISAIARSKLFSKEEQTFESRIFHYKAVYGHCGSALDDREEQKVFPVPSISRVGNHTLLRFHFSDLTKT